MLSSCPTACRPTPIRGRSPIARPFLHLSCILLGFALATSAAVATSYVMATDDELLERADVIVLGRVLAAEPALGTVLPRTEYFVEVEDVLKGFVSGNTIPVRVLGGRATDGRVLRVHGMPQFVREERVLLFLNSGAAGTFSLVEHALGAFREVESGDRRFALRNLSQANLVQRDNDPQVELRQRSHLLRDLDQFADWIRDRAQGRTTEAGYFVDSLPVPLRIEERFNLSESPGDCGASAGTPLRFFGFETGAKQTYRALNSGSPGISGGGFSSLPTAAKAWNNHSGSTINITIGNNTSATDTTTINNINQILFEDPTDELAGSFSGSGTLAINYAWFTCATRTFSGGKAHVIEESDIITQNGFGENFVALSSNPARAFEEVIAHELGHGVGLAHSCGDPSPSCTGGPGDALMNPFAHDDGRGATLGTDDKSGIVFLYGASAGGPSAPQDLTAIATSSSEIQLSWLDSSNNEDAFVVEEKTATGEYSEIVTLEANVTSLEVTGLAPATYRSYRIRAINSSGSSPYSNEAGATTNGVSGACIPSTTELCLNKSRFQVSVDYRFVNGQNGQAKASTLTSDTGYFTFLNPSNVEIVIKVLNGCSGFETYWVFAAGLTDVEIVLTVVDTDNGAAKTYVNELGTPFQPIQDISAFATCP